MNIFKNFACTTALCLAAGQSVASVYPLTMGPTIDVGGITSTASATGQYDDVTGDGNWTMTLDIPGFGTVVFDQDWTMDSATGTGSVSAPYNCSGDSTACFLTSIFFLGSWSASPTPVSSGLYTFTMNSGLGVVTYNVNTATTEPAVSVSLDLPTADYECVNGGAQVAASSNVSLLNGAELESLAWYVDGQAVASTESLSEFLTLGQHTIKVVATITTGDSASAEKVVNITDNSAPVINAFFSDARTGEAITSIATKNTSFVVTNFSATDTCDPNPVVEGFGGFGLNSGNTLKIQGNLDKVELNTSSIQMMVKATDSSGKTTETVKTLSITH